MAAGDQACFSEFYDAHHRRVWAIAARVLRDTYEADDVTQEVFLQVWRSPGTFDQTRGAISAWLSVLCRSRAIERLRRCHRRERLNERWLPPSAAVHPTSDASILTGQILATLSPEAREALKLAYLEGLTQAEIAARLDEPLGTIKSRTRAGLQLLRARVVDPEGRPDGNRKSRIRDRPRANGA